MKPNANTIVEVYGSMTKPNGAKAALIKTAGGQAYWVLPSEVDGRMPKPGELIDPSKHEERKQRTTMPPIEALANAVALLREIARGQAVTSGEIETSVARYEDTLSDMRHQANIEARNRAAIRSMSEQRRGA